MDPTERLSKLTERQREVLRLFCDGLAYKAIGEELFIEEPTVRAHMGNIYMKLGIDDLPPAKRKIVLAQEYCPLLREGELPPGPPDETEEPEPVPEPIMKMVEEDERAIVTWRPLRVPVTVIEPSRTVIEPQPPQQPRRLQWLVVGMVLGALLIGGIIYVLWRFLGTEEPVVKYIEVTREVTVEVTTTSALPQPTLVPVVQTQEATATREQDTPTIAPPTPTPTPTNTPVPPTLTPTPMPTSTVLEDTPPGSILEVGESWQQNNVRLRLDGVDFRPHEECLILRFNLFNDTDHTMVMTIEGQDFSVADNLGRQWQFYDFGFCTYGCSGAILLEEIAKAVDAGKRFSTEGCGSWKASFSGFVTDTSVDEVIVTVDGLSQISDARWRIPIYH